MEIELNEKPKNLSVFVENAIRKAIISGSIQPNQVLYANKLASVFDVSRMPVREALSRLDAKGIIDVIDGKGSLVKKLSQEDYLEICVARQIIEPSIVEIATNKCTDDQLCELEDILNKSKDYLKSREISKFSLTNYEFHIKIADFSGNKQLKRISDNLNILMTLEWSTMRRDSLNWDHSISEHFNIISAMKKRDSLLAKNNMLFHLMRHVDRTI